MFGRSRTSALKDSASSASDFASSLAKDKKFRKELLSAISHGTIAQRRASRKVGFVAVATRLAGDPKLKREVKKMVNSLDKAWGRAEKKRSHRLRNFLLLLGIGGPPPSSSPPRAAGAPAPAPPPRGARRKVIGGVRSGVPMPGGTTPRTIEESIE